jgi:hypothetical protein
VTQAHFSFLISRLYILHFDLFVMSEHNVRVDNILQWKYAAMGELVTEFEQPELVITNETESTINYHVTFRSRQRFMSGDEMMTRALADIARDYLGIQWREDIVQFVEAQKQKQRERLARKEKEKKEIEIEINGLFLNEPEE